MAADNLHKNKMTNNSAVVSNGLSAGSTVDVEGQSKNKSRKINKFWFNSAIFSLVSGVVTMLFGLIACIAVWTNGQYLNESRLGTISTWLLIDSFALLFIGSYCLDKAYDSVYRRSLQATEKEFNNKTNS
jgi:hypothetical protein